MHLLMQNVRITTMMITYMLPKLQPKLLQKYGNNSQKGNYNLVIKNFNSTENNIFMLFFIYQEYIRD